jgi:sulfate/thiosulfate transport system substrate-binding protein
MPAKISRRSLLALALAPACAPLRPRSAVAAGPVLLNASYDATRELYRDIDLAFVADYRARTGETVAVRTAHAGSGAQARAVIDGLPADIVTLGLAGDIDAIAAKSHKIASDWQKRLPQNSSPYRSTIVFVVRAGNPKAIADWQDLVRPGVAVVMPNPKTSGGARWNYLAAWGYATRRFAGDDAAVKDFMAALYRNVPVLDTSARGATVSFALRHLGDVLVGWESDANLIVNEFGKDKFAIVNPSVSILAEPPVAIVDANVVARGTRPLAEAYVRFLYAPQAQAIIARHFYRPVDRAAAAPDDLARFPELDLLNVDKDFGGWAKAQARFFADGALFDQIYAGH